MLEAMAVRIGSNFDSSSLTQRFVHLENHELRRLAKHSRGHKRSLIIGGHSQQARPRPRRHHEMPSVFASDLYGATGPDRHLRHGSRLEVLLWNPRVHAVLPIHDHKRRSPGGNGPGRPEKRLGTGHVMETHRGKDHVEPTFDPVDLLTWKAFDHNGVFQTRHGIGVDADRLRVQSAGELGQQPPAAATSLQQTNRAIGPTKMSLTHGRIQGPLCGLIRSGPVSRIAEPAGGVRLCRFGNQRLHQVVPTLLHLAQRNPKKHTHLSSDHGAHPAPHNQRSNSDPNLYESTASVPTVSLLSLGRSLLSTVMTKKKKNHFYAYRHEADSGIVTNWPECERIVKGRKAHYKGFQTRAEAQAWLDAGARYEPRKAKKRQDQSELPKDAIFFDAGTGRGMGVEVRVTERDGTPLTFLAVPEQDITAEGNLRLAGRTNNYGELTACSLAIQIAQKQERRLIMGDSRLVLDYWSKGHINHNTANSDPDLAALVRKVAAQRRAFEAQGGRLMHVSGDINPADLGFHR